MRIAAQQSQGILDILPYISPDMTRDVNSKDESPATESKIKLNRQAELLMQRHNLLKSRQNEITRIQTAKQDVQKLSSDLENISDNSNTAVVTKILSVIGQLRGIIGSTSGNSSTGAELKNKISSFTRDIVSGETMDASSMLDTTKGILGETSSFLEERETELSSMLKEFLVPLNPPSMPSVNAALSSVHNFDIERLGMLF